VAVQQRIQQLGIVDSRQLDDEDAVKNFIANRLAMAQINRAAVTVKVSRKTGAVTAEYKSVEFEWTD
jgi:hypothetical protein